MHKNNVDKVKLLPYIQKNNRKGGSHTEKDQTSLNQFFQENFLNCEEIELLTRGSLFDSPYIQSIGQGYYCL